MLLPTKEIDPDQALLSVGATLISLLEAPATVSDLWERFRQHTRRTGCHARVAFDWFALALSMLFTLQVVRWNDNQELERCHAPA